MMRRALARETGTFARLLGRVGDLAETLRDRLSGEMHDAIARDLRLLGETRRALRPTGRSTGGQVMGIGPMTDFVGGVLAFSATVSGYAAENMVRGGGRLFLELGRRIERAQAIAEQLAHALDQPAERIEAGLGLALELCDSTLTYRSRYLTVLQPAPVLDLVIADEGNPRGLMFQLTTARDVLTVLGGHGSAKLPASLEIPMAEARAIVAELVSAADQSAAAAKLAPRLRAMAATVAALSDVVTRTYFALLPVTWTDALQ
jgi:uncharacterized alpha-E superfamily protein